MFDAVRGYIFVSTGGGNGLWGEQGGRACFPGTNSMQGFCSCLFRLERWKVLTSSNQLRFDKWVQNGGVASPLGSKRSLKEWEFYPSAVGVLAPCHRSDAMPAVVAADWRVVKQKWVAWKTSNPNCDPLALPRGRRLWDRDAWAAYAWVSRSANGPMRALQQPCVACGYPTTGFCEACPSGEVPYPMCPDCDREQLVCVACMMAGRTFQSGQAAHSATSAGEQMEVNGITMEDGEFLRFREPLVIPAAEIPMRSDGSLDQDALLQKIHDHAVKLQMPMWGKWLAPFWTQFWWPADKWFWLEPTICFLWGRLPIGFGWVNSTRGGALTLYL